MAVRVRHPEAADRVALEVEFDQHHRFVSHHPAVVARLDRHNLRRLVLDHTAVVVLDVNFAAGEKADVGVHAEVGPDNRFHVDRPAESGRVHHTLDARGAGTSHVEPDVADFAALGAFHRREQRIRCRRLAPSCLGSCRGRKELPGLLLRRLLLFCHVILAVVGRWAMLAREAEAFHSSRASALITPDAGDYTRRTAPDTCRASLVASKRMPAAATARWARLSKSGWSPDAHLRNAQAAQGFARSGQPRCDTFPRRRMCRRRGPWAVETARARNRPSDCSRHRSPPGTRHPPSNGRSRAGPRAVRPGCRGMPAAIRTAPARRAPTATHARGSFAKPSRSDLTTTAHEVSDR